MKQNLLISFWACWVVVLSGCATVNRDLAKKSIKHASPIYGTEYVCEDMVNVVNNLRHLGKTGALALLQQHLEEVGQHGPTQQRVKVLIICRLLFVNPEGWPPPRLGQPLPEIDWRAGRQFPLFPIALSDNVPFLLIRGYGSVGYSSDTPEKCLKLCETFQIISADLSKTGYQAAASKLVNRQQFHDLYLTEAARGDAVSMILSQAKPSVITNNN